MEIAKTTCNYCKEDTEPKVAHHCIDEYATRFAVAQRYMQKVFASKEAFEKVYSSEFALSNDGNEALATLFDVIEGMKGAHGGAAAKETLERIERSIAFADAALWLDQVGDDKHKPIYEEAKIKWARYKAENDCPRYPTGKISNEIEMCNRLLKETGEKRTYSTKDMAEAMRALRERLERLTIVAAYLLPMKDERDLTKEEAKELGLDVENDPQLNGVLDEVYANPSRFVDKEHAHSIVICLERHFKRISRRLDEAGFSARDNEDTIENRLQRALSELNLHEKGLKP